MVAEINETVAAVLFRRYSRAFSDSPGSLGTSVWSVGAFPRRAASYLLGNYGAHQMTDLDRLHTLAGACVQAAHEVNAPETAAMLLETAHRFLRRHPGFACDAQANDQHICEVFKH